MKIHTIHPKYISNEILNVEHDFIHKLFDVLSDEEASMEHPDYFRYNGRRGRLYVRHRKLVEEMNIRGLSHTTEVDRRVTESDEWEEPEVTAEEIAEEAAWLRENTGDGRVKIPEGADADTLVAANDLTSVMMGMPVASRASAK